jgi:hypothetical protein
MTEAFTILAVSVLSSVPLLYFVAYKYLAMAQVRMEQKIALAEESRKSMRELVTVAGQMVTAYAGFLQQYLAPRRASPTQMVFDLGDLNNLGSIRRRAANGGEGVGDAPGPVPPNDNEPVAGGNGDGHGSGAESPYSDLPPLEDDVPRNVPVDMSRSTILEPRQEEQESTDITS